MARSTLKDTWTIYTLVAQLAGAVAKLVAASAITNGTLPGNAGLAKTLLEEILATVDNMLVLGTHAAIMAESLAASSGAVQRMRVRIGADSDPASSAEELRELVASLLLQAVQTTEEGGGPDTERNDSVAEGTDEEEPWLDARLRGE